MAETDAPSEATLAATPPRTRSRERAGSTGAAFLRVSSLAMACGAGGFDRVTMGTTCSTGCEATSRPSRSAATAEFRIVATASSDAALLASPPGRCRTSARPRAASMTVSCQLF